MRADRGIRIDSLVRRASLAKGTLVAYFFMVALNVALAAVLLRAQFGDSVLTSLLPTLDTALILPTTAITLASGFAFLLWLYRASRNLVDAGVSDLRRSPAWTIASYFIPFVNLVVPFRAMREIYNRSHGEEAWHADADVGDVSSWWSCYIGGLVLQIGLLIVALINLVPGVFVTTPPGVHTALGILMSLLLVGSGLFQWKIISAVTSAQRSLAHIGGVFD